MKTSKWGRFSQFAALGAGLVGEAVKGSLRQAIKNVEEKAGDQLRTRIQQAELLAQTLGELKGAAMKFGQILSLQGQELFPPQVQQVLARLQKDAPALPGAQMRAIVEKELGSEKTLELQYFSDQPLASASIGQVHKADFLKQKNCVIKVQYPGVAEAIDSDLAMLKKIIQGATFITQTPIQIDEVMAEARELLLQETDYEIEIQNLLKFKEILKDDTRFILPEPIPDYSSKKILTMTYEQGLSINDFLQKKPSLSLRNEVGGNLLDLVLKEVFTYRIVQTDPNFANYLFRYEKNGEHETCKVILLDFGATRSYAEKFIQNYRKFVAAPYVNNQGEFFATAYEMNFLNPTESAEVHEMFWQLCKLYLEPFFGEYDFSTSDLPQRIARQTIAFQSMLKKSPPPREILFLNRKLGGVFQILRKLQVKANYSNIFEQILP